LDVDRFDLIARRFSRFASRRSLVRGTGIGLLGVVASISGRGPLSTLDAEGKKKNKKKCDRPENACQESVLVKGKKKKNGGRKTTCQIRNKADGTSCGSNVVCAGGVCSPQCGAGNSCSGQTTCCSNACVNTQTNLSNCGACNIACGNNADSCVGGVCMCGANAACAGGQVCDSGTCICPANKTCAIKVSPSNLNGWFGYNDENDTIDNALLDFVVGPDNPPDGVGSVQMTVTGTQRHNVATYQFAGTPLDDITELKFTTFNPTNANYPNGSGYLHFNIDFTGTSDAFQGRIGFVPDQNGNVKPDQWQEWDAIRTGAAQWFSSRAWPAPNPQPAFSLKSWDQILADYPAARIKATDAFLGIRVGEPYPDGFTGNIGSFTFGTSETQVFDFEPD